MIENLELFSSCFSQDDSEIKLKHCKSSRIALIKFSREYVVHLIGLNEHTLPSDSIAQLVKRKTAVPEGVSSNPARVNSFAFDFSSVKNHECFSSCFSEDEFEIDSRTFV